MEEELQVVLQGPREEVRLLEEILAKGVMLMMVAAAAVAGMAAAAAATTTAAAAGQVTPAVLRILFLLPA